MRSSFKASGASNRKFEHVALLNQWSESLVQVGMQDWHVPRCNNDDPFTDGRMDGEVAYACIYFKRTVQALRGNMHSPLGPRPRWLRQQAIISSFFLVRSQSP